MTVLTGAIAIKELMPVFHLLKRRLLDVIDDIEANIELRQDKKTPEGQIFETALNRHSKGQYFKLSHQLFKIKNLSSKRNRTAFFKRRAALATMVTRARQDAQFEAHIERLRAENLELEDAIAQEAQNMQPLKAALLTLPKVERLCIAALKTGIERLDIADLNLAERAPQSTLNQVSQLARASQAILKMANPDDLAKHLD